MFEKNSDAVPRPPPGLERRLLHSCSSEKEDTNNANNPLRNNFDNDLMSVSGTLSQTTISQDQHQLFERMMSSQQNIMNEALHGSSSIQSYRTSSSGGNSMGVMTANDNSSNNVLQRHHHHHHNHDANDRDLYQPIPANGRNNPFLLPDRLRTHDNGDDLTHVLSVIFF